jgi:hypothetical protein
MKLLCLLVFNIKTKMSKLGMVKNKGYGNTVQTSG